MKSELGFSLIETLVAVVVFAAVSAAGVGVYSNYQKGQTSLFVADALTTRLQAVQQVLKEDMDSVLVRPVRGVYGGTEPAFKSGEKGNSDTPLLRFVRGGKMVMEAGTSLPSLELVEYWLKEGQLVRRSYSQPDRTPDSVYHDQTLITGVKALEIRFQKDTVWLQDWQPASLAGSYMPDLVDLKLQLGGKGTVHTLLAVGVRG
ncbi:type II secretion system minor pseudopilin GspJ [Kordiimonas pumila]|uniref:Type II secretion system protein J n=1 Tax=Kordiimonas pumila TaxID=2161677 RepID=A0ABV7D723_9PROT|nr:type II secretion system minor pseudopilin GspJ [Kordiimonas pumila]